VKAEGEDRIQKAVEQALASPLLDVSDISGAYGVLIHISGGEDMTLGEVTQAGEIILEKAPNTGRIVWGAKVDESLQDASKLQQYSQVLWTLGNLHNRARVPKYFFISIDN